MVTGCWGLLSSTHKTIYLPPTGFSKSTSAYSQPLAHLSVNMTDSAKRSVFLKLGVLQGKKSMQPQASCKVEKAQESQVCLIPGAVSLLSLALVIGLRTTIHTASYIFVCLLHSVLFLRQRLSM